MSSEAPITLSASDVEQEASAWLVRQDSDRWTEADALEFEAWLGASTARRLAYLRLKSAWEKSARLAALAPAPLTVREKAPCPVRPARTWTASLKRRLCQQRPIRRLGASIALTASVAVIALIAQPWLGRDTDAQLSAGIGERQAVRLADGSHVLLNTNTRLQAQVDAHRRHVRLMQGEAYFEVAHDAGRPFVIDAGDHRVTVLGTRFTVRVDRGLVQVKVVEGKVRLDAASNTDLAQPAEAVLTRNEVAIADQRQILVTEKTAEQLSNDLSWRTGRLVLDQMTLAEAAVEFNRYNRQQLIINDPAVAQMRIGGSFDVGNVVAFIRLLQGGLGLKVQFGPDTITVGA